MVDTSQSLRWFTALLLVLSGAASPAGGSIRAPKTIARFHDPVIVKTYALNALPTRRTGNLRLYSARSGRVAPIPFQFDARDEAGDLIMPEPGAERVSTFDDNDELVFMAKDTGDRVSLDSLPQTADGVLEIEVTDPMTGERGWTYLLDWREQSEAASSVTYVTFDRDGNRVRTPLYSVDYQPERSFIAGMRIEAAAGKSRDQILGALKLRINPTFSLALMRWSPKFSEEDFSAVIDGVKAGPVRVIERVQERVDLGRFLPSRLSGVVYTHYYFSSFIRSSTFSLPWLALKSLRRLRFLMVQDLTPSAAAMTYWDGANPAGLKIGERRSASINTTEDHEWWAVSGKSGGCLHVFLIPPEWREWGIARGTIFLDNGAALEEEEAADARPGVPAVGFSLLHMTRLQRAGDHRFTNATIALPHGYRPGDEDGVLAMFNRPLSVEVRKLK